MIKEKNKEKDIECNMHEYQNLVSNKSCCEIYIQF